MIITERAGLTDHAMTWNDECDRIRAHRAADRARRSRLPDRSRQTTIRCECTGRDTEQSAPDLQLKRRAPHKSAQDPAIRSSTGSENSRGQFSGSSVIAI